MKKKIILNGKSTALQPAQLIQSGGEGMVFAVAETAVKLYHHPTPQHAARLRHLLDSGLAARLPSHVLAPCALVEDGRGHVAGFQMPLLPAGSHPCKQWANPIFRQKMNVTTLQVIHFLREIHTTLQQLHKMGVIVGDLNDRNLFFTLPAATTPPAPATAWVDVDSYQFGRFSCPVATLAFLDPALYHVNDFSQASVFTALTDWYAYFVLLVKSLLQVHPYGGVHRQHKSLAARATAGITLLDTAVTYPQRAAPLESLSDDLLHHLHLVCGEGQRMPFPVSLLDDYAARLITCRQCGLVYPAQRPGCPACRQQTPVPQVAAGQKNPRLLLEVDGFIEDVAVQPSGRLLAVVRSGDVYKVIRLGIGGRLGEMVLFNAGSGYRCRLFGHFLAVNPLHSGQLLILDAAGDRPQQVAMVETALFRETAVFATTPRHLYRIAGNWIMRGSVRNGHYLEEGVATAHRAQTCFWASPYGETVAGYHRIFAQTRFFMLDGQGAGCDLAVPVPAAGERVANTAVRFGPRTVAIVQQIGRQGEIRHQTHVFDQRGQLIHTLRETAVGDSPETHIPHHYPYTTILSYPAPPFIPLSPSFTPAPEETLLAHPGGILIRQPSRLYLAR